MPSGGSSMLHCLHPKRTFGSSQQRTLEQNYICLTALQTASVLTVMGGNIPSFGDHTCLEIRVWNIGLSL